MAQPLRTMFTAHHWISTVKLDYMISSIPVEWETMAFRQLPSGRYDMGDPVIERRYVSEGDALAGHLAAIEEIVAIERGN